MGISSNSHRKNFDQINITPLTDIFLVLLIIMMVIAPLLDQKGLSLMVPNVQDAKNIKEKSKLITVNVSEDDKYTLDNKPVSEGELIYSIQDAAKEKKDGLIIQAADNATHGAVVAVMDAARNAGVLNISIVEK
jgi:biopolymer transport protein ExbD